MQSAVCVGKVLAMSRAVRSRESLLVEAAITKQGRWGQWQGRGSAPAPRTASSQHPSQWDRGENRHLNSLSKGYTASDKTCKHKYNKKPW